MTEVLLEKARVPYRETIRKSVKVQGRHKKQSGGHGQFGDVWIEFEPTISDELVFEEKVFGGAVPKNYFPDDDDTKAPIVTWRSHANLLYQNWLNYYVYQTTPYDIKEI